MSKDKKDNSKLLQDLYLKEPLHNDRLFEISKEIVKYSDPDTDISRAEYLKVLSSLDEVKNMKFDNGEISNERILQNILFFTKHFFLKVSRVNYITIQDLTIQRNLYKKEVSNSRMRTYNNDKWVIFHNELISRVIKLKKEKKYNLKRPGIKNIYEEIIQEWYKDIKKPSIEAIYKDYQRNKHYINMLINSKLARDKDK